MADTRDDIDSIKRLTLAPAVLRRIKRMILTGEIRVGEKVKELSIAKRLDVSRGPVREACSQLAAMGYVDSIPQRGSFVRRVSFEEAQEVYEVRIALAGGVGALAAERATGEQLETLRAMPASMRSANEARNLDAISELSELFHKVIAQATGNQTLIHTLSSLHVTHRLFRLRVLQELDDQSARQIAHNQDAIRERRTVIDAIVSRDAGAAAAAMELYLRATRDRSRARYAETLGDKPCGEASET